MMRELLQDFPAGQVLYIFTTEGHVRVGSIVNLIDDVVFLLAPDRQTQININLSDVSGVRPYIHEPEEPLP